MTRCRVKLPTRLILISYFLQQLTFDGSILIYGSWEAMEDRTGCFPPAELWQSLRKRSIASRKWRIDSPLAEIMQLPAEVVKKKKCTCQLPYRLPGFIGWLTYTHAVDTRLFSCRGRSVGMRLVVNHESITLRKKKKEVCTCATMGTTSSIPLAIPLS